jgi:predicted nucleotidyltransferase component of viral defense system
LTEIGEIGLTHDQFLSRLPAAERIGSAARHQRDYALTRIVMKNCAAVGEHADEGQQTDFVVKGGFAIRHLYAGVRYSKDADLAMSADDLELEGPPMMRYPSDMKAGNPSIGQNGESWFIPVSYRRTDNAIDETRIDLNDRSRALKSPPPQRRTLTSLFVQPTKVWAASTEEIVGEKLCALMDQSITRIKDLFDIRHILAMPAEGIDAAETRRIYQAVRQGKGQHVPKIEDVPRTIRTIITTAATQNQWQVDVLDFVDDAPTLSGAAAEMIDLLNERVLKD